MVLSDSRIQQELDEGNLEIEPLDDEQIQPASIDLRLDSGTAFYEPQSEPIRADKHDVELTETNSNGEILFPAHSFCLASTQESIELPDYLAGDLKGRSSIGRMGLHIHTAGWCDPGWHGDDITLEIVNHTENGIIIPVGTRVCQLVLSYVDGEVEEVYDGKYNGQSGPTGSRIDEDDEFNRPDLP
jgi:dCTP deaminase